MKALLWNISLALAWAAVTGDMSAANLLFGSALGFAVLLSARPFLGIPQYGRRVIDVILLAGFFVRELIKANLRVAFDVLTPRHHMRPGIIAVHLDARTDPEITLLANLITLTPGTLSLDVSEDRSTLYVHAMYMPLDAERLRDEIKHGFERRVLAVMR